MNHTQGFSHQETRQIRILIKYYELYYSPVIQNKEKRKLIHYIYRLKLFQFNKVRKNKKIVLYKKGYDLYEFGKVFVVKCQKEKHSN